MVKNIKIFLLMSFCTLPCVAYGAIDWWNHPTICQIDNTPCYGNITAGLDSSLETGWDVSGKCRGKKYICADALVDGVETVVMERADIMRGVGINSDFDTSVYVVAGNCYGARRTKNNNTMVSVGGKYVNVWCNGVLANPSEQVSNGEFVIGAQPTCAELANDGYVAVLNGTCYGKYYNSSEYAIECSGNDATLIILNGADYVPSDATSMTQSTANARFDAMAASAAAQREIYFQ